MITLCGFGAAFGLPDASPFVLKVAAYMHMAGVPFEYKMGMDNLKNAPKKQLPYIVDGERIIPDSQHIIEYLKHDKKADLDAWLNPEQKALSYLITKSIDENFYWCLVHSRWIKADTWPQVRENFFADMPFPLKNILPSIIRKGQKKAMYEHGIGRHSDAQILDIAKQNFQALSDLLGDKDFMLGEQPCTLDATAYGTLAGLILVSLDNEINSAGREYPTLVAYCKRIQDRYFSETS